jgi:predicted ATPase
MKEFAPFRLDPVNQCLWHNGESREGERILLTPKAFAVLSYLVDRAGRLVTQAELLEAVWPDTFVQPEVLKYQISDIRSVLGDVAKNRHFIETLPRRGYRFIAAVRETDSSETAPYPAGLVGRRRELALLMDRLRGISRGQRQVVFITGELGIGKTALVDEFVRQALADDPALYVGHGQCAEGNGRVEPFYPMLEAVGQLCHGRDGSRVVEILTANAPTWLAQFPALFKTEHRQTLQREILGATRDRMLREIREALAILTAEMPLLLVFEDFQWVDPSTIDLFSALARERSWSKMMLVATQRSAEVDSPDHALKRLQADLFIHHLCYEIALTPLSQADVVEFLRTQCPRGSLPEGFPELIHRRSDGNPLFMLADFERMIENGQISRDHGKLELRVPIEQIDLDVPETLRQMIEAEIDRLTMEEQRALEAASVAGLTFSAAVIAAALQQDADSILDLFERLSRRSRIIRVGGSQQSAEGSISQRFEFVHVLYREVLYQRQTPARTANLQRRMREQETSTLRVAAKPA